mmetsp:Transcript_10026/g.9693  ORF Transcript_10026/g.9693 Transcript_10026/m.9693 type:complete len:82 (-) Transcript_10026:21-266(-)
MNKYSIKHNSLNYCTQHVCFYTKPKNSRIIIERKHVLNNTYIRHNEKKAMHIQRKPCTIMMHADNDNNDTTVVGGIYSPSP